MSDDNLCELSIFQDTHDFVSSSEMKSHLGVYFEIASPHFCPSSLSPLSFHFSFSSFRRFDDVVDDVTCRETPAPRGRGETQLNCLSDRNEAVIATFKYAVRVFGASIVKAISDTNGRGAAPSASEPRIFRGRRARQKNTRALIARVMRGGVLKYGLINCGRSRAR